MTKEAILKGLNPEQKTAVEIVDGPLLVIAGAGSGKTSVLTRRIAYLVEVCGVQPWNILAITFTNKAAKEMKEREFALLGASADDIWMSTFHSLCVRILRRFADRIGYSTNFSIADSSEQLTLVKHILKDLNFDPKMYNPRAILGTISNAKNDLLTPTAYAKNAKTPFEKATAQVYERYQASLVHDMIMDFDDLIMQTLRLLKTNADVLDHYQNQFKYILVDEYQDTNQAQYELCQLLSEKYHNICVVGDADQSIYGWRGANMQNILNFENDYKQYGAQTVKLEQNYRSTGHILSAANSVIANNRERKAKNLWTALGDGEKVKYYHAASGDAEAQFIISKIKELVDEKHYKYDDFAVLYRANAQSRTVEEKFVKANIPYQIVGGHKFYDRKEIKDLLAYLKLAANPDDTMSFNRIINVPKRGLGAASVANLLDYQAFASTTLLDALLNVDSAYVSARALPKLHEFGEVIQSAKAAASSMSITGLTEKLLNDSGYSDALKQENTLEAKTRLENLDEFLSVTKKFDEGYEGEDRLNDFLAEISLLSDQDDMEDQSHEVTLMTLHAAKGLEFPVVFLVGMEEGLFPSSRSVTEGNLEEERRLAYVGITRAKRVLYLTNATKRFMYGHYSNNEPSRFLDEIDEKDIEAIATKVASFTSFNLPFDTQKSDKPAKATVAKKATGAVGAEKQGWNVGDQVAHKAWGTGVVTKVNGEGEDMELDIAFKDKGIKRLLAAFAPITKI
ncbi:MAG: DNA helicase PcrA [Lactobacillus sp.]|nr:DNA helicase PcrA [Lactobacillus sp.]